MATISVSVKLELITEDFNCLRISYVYSEAGKDETKTDLINILQENVENEVNFLKRMSQLINDKESIVGIVKSNIINTNNKINREEETVESLQEKIIQQIKDIDNIRFEFEMEDGQQ